MKMVNKNIIRSAFSLIELSIVLIVIGLVVSAVIGGKKLVSAARLQSAKLATQSSPVNSIEGLHFWTDSISEDSFDPDEVQDHNPIATDNKISSWKDINKAKSAIARDSFDQDSELLKPTYIKDGPNGLPVIRFDGSNDFMSISGTKHYSNFAIFVVYKTTVTHGIDQEATGGIKGTSGQKYLFGAEHGQNSGGAGVGLSVGTNGISVYEHASGYMPPLAVYQGTAAAQFNVTLIEYIDNTPYIYINGNQVHQGLQSNKNSYAPRQLGGGSYGNFAGDVAEIIIYSRSLSDDEKSDINSYLMNKWGIK